MAISFKIFKLSACQTQVNQELSMAEWGIFVEDLTNMISAKIGSNWPSSLRR